MTTPAPDSGPRARGERALLRRLGALLRPPQGPPLAVPFGDDMAALPLQPGETPLWTVDMLMDGVDFLSAEHSWEQIGRKALAVNLSDCAAMGAVPRAALCAVALENRLSMDDALALHRGIEACGREFDCPLVGGDTNSWSAPTVIAITVAGGVPAGGRPIRRDGARPGDSVWLTGPVGGSLLGRHLTFTPRVALGARIARALHPHAMIDVSDGLAIDLDRILEASGCGATLDAAALAALIHPDAERRARDDGRSAQAHALYDGEDFELMVVLPPETSAEHAARLGLHALGRIDAAAGLRLRQANGDETPIPIAGWEHFQ